MAWAQQYTTATPGGFDFALEPVVAWLTSYVLTGEMMRNAVKSEPADSGRLLLVELAAELKRVLQKSIRS